MVALGSETVIMFTIGIIAQTTPISEKAMSTVRSVAVALFTMKSASPTIVARPLAKSTGLGPSRTTILPASGPTASIASVAGAIVSPVETIPRPRPNGLGSSA